MLPSPTYYLPYMFMYQVIIIIIYIIGPVRDCALYAMAVVTSLASNADPDSVIFDQVDLRSHFRQCM